MLGNSLENGKLAEWLKVKKSRFLDAYTLGYDTLLLTAGFLATCDYLQAKTSGNNCKMISQCFKKIMRITPSIGSVILIYTNLLEHVGSGPEYPKFIKENSEVCRTYWWSTLLFIHNYFPSNKMVIIF